MQYVRPDVCMVGGISGTKKVAALAEARHVGVVPHNPLSPVSTAACLQVAAAIPNFALQELPLGETVPPKSAMVDGIHPHDGEGYIRLTDRPGIGVTLKPDAAQNAPYKPREIHTRLGADGGGGGSVEEALRLIRSLILLKIRLSLKAGGKSMRSRGKWLIEGCKQHLVDVMGSLAECQPGEVGGRNSDIERAAGFEIELKEQRRWFTWTLLNSLVADERAEVVRDGRNQRYRLPPDSCHEPE